MCDEMRALKSLLIITMQIYQRFTLLKIWFNISSKRGARKDATGGW